MRLVRAMRRLLSTNTTLYLPLRRLRKPKTVVSRKTELMIEGFPRSGNTWTEALIRHCRPEGIQLAHHSHAAAHVQAAVRFGVPVMVLFRDPDAAVASYLTLTDNCMDARDAYLDYVVFYRATRRLAGRGATFFSFEDVIERPGAVIAALNATYGLGLRTDGLESPQALEAIFARMDCKAKRIGLRGGKSDSRPGTASDSKPEIKAQALRAMEAPKSRSTKAAAHAVYGTLVSSLRAPETPAP